MKVSLALTTAGLVLLAAISATLAAGQSSPVTLVQLPLGLPAVGNLDAVRQWRFGRIQSTELAGDSPDVRIEIRILNGSVIRVVGPRRELVELARRTNWLNRHKSRPTRQDYVERMIAFDVDSQQRLIAMMSLEPMDRDRNRLRRALGGS